ncbi:hypothetical protein Nepgr_031979 [Nepenthes gracilis]|uniref:Beta-fructofuranosidase n=1 Tax=Nepenthes gracilis TaxID=150966 RepID=A0AAD3Y7Y6_NEPGR|nr:hypothetical protein Nepgr_031979 [Nepenthes gracilis]
MYFNGVYHLFYQHNPRAPVWGKIVWAHSVSMDMINWVAVEPALIPSKSYDINGCWSGSTTILPGNKPAILYTGVDYWDNQVQNIALPANLSDPYLRKWVKQDYNPIIKASSDINSSFFRDPTTAWSSQGHWNILIGGRRRRRGMAYLYRSRDFKTWTKAQHPLHSAPHTGMWECPDFYPVSLHGKKGLDTSVLGEDIRHVLKVSLDETRYEYYTVGTYDTDEGKYVPYNTFADGWSGVRYDYGNFYASKTFFDGKNGRRVLWGWVNESTTKLEDVRKGWAGVLTIPRTVWLDGEGRQLLQWPIKELEELRGFKFHLTKQELKSGDLVEVKGITPAQADVEVVFSFSSLEKAEPLDQSWIKRGAQQICMKMGSTVQGGLGPFGLLTLASDTLDEYTPVFFRIFKAQNNKHVVLMCSDASSSSLDRTLYKPSFAGFVDMDLTDGKLSLKSLIDNSVVESFGGGGKIVITSRVYPTKAVLQKAHLHAFNNGTEKVIIENLNAWSMKKPLLMNNK